MLRRRLLVRGLEGHFELVKLNLQNPAVVDYLLESVRRWAEVFGIDGLRLDVAYMLDRDFMRRLHTFTRELKPDFVLIGETLHGDYNQIVNDEMLDSCTNYECYKGLYSSFNSVNMFEIAHSLHRQFGGDPWCIYRGKHLLSFVDNHDVPRLASILTDKSCLQPRLRHALWYAGHSRASTTAASGGLPAKRAAPVATGRCDLRSMSLRPTS